MKEITLACEAFQKLLEEQLERIRNMNGEKTDFSAKKQVTIGVIDGDGIGPVITAQATRVLEKLLQGAWDEEVCITAPGAAFDQADFLRRAAPAGQA